MDSLREDRCRINKRGPEIFYNFLVFQHERSCKYRPYICPYIECDHKLAFGAVVDHVSIAHRSVRIIL